MVGIFITARLGSSRLKEKHLICVENKPMIVHLVDRLKCGFESEINSGSVSIFLVTSCLEENKKFDDIFLADDVRIFYGHDSNIPLRHLECAETHHIEYILSVDGDDILCSINGLKLVLNSLLSGVARAKTIGLPLGMNVSGYSKEHLKMSLKDNYDTTLETGWDRIFDSKDVENILVDTISYNTDLRVTLDYPDDVKFFSSVIQSMTDLGMTDNEIIGLIEKHELYSINSHLKDIYWSNFNSLKEQEKSS